MSKNPTTVGQRKIAKATETELGELHKVLAETMIMELRSGNTKPAFLNSVRQFLKDNGIECDGGSNPEMMELLNAIPDVICVDDFEGEGAEEGIDG